MITHNIKLQDFYSCPVIPLNIKNEQFVFEHEVVEFVFNSYGYRTHEFDNISQHIVVSGCSLTEGHGLHHYQTWAAQYENAVGITLYNLAKGCSSADFVSQVLQNWIYTHKPQLVIAQWPNPFRSLTWNNSLAKFSLPTDFDEIYRVNLKNGIENFYYRWCNSIITLDRLCRLKKIPIVHICLETHNVVDPALDILKQFDIDLHYDMKMPDKTWYFDNSALDQCHHSEWCNTKWTERLLNLSKKML